MRLDPIEPSLAIWSGINQSLLRCCHKCLNEQNCVSLLYNSTDKSCKLFQVIYSLEDESGDDIVESYILDKISTRWVPESCKDVVTCSGITKDGEYWISQNTNRQRVKIFCYNMASDPSEYITLRNTNSFIEHDPSNWPIMNMQYFENLWIGLHVCNADWFTYVTVREIRDCNGKSFRSPCPHFANATINTKGTGLVIDPSLTWGVIKGYYPKMRDFRKSPDGAEISFTCAGWCARCGPTSGSIIFKVSNEFISAAEAQALICHN